MERLQVRARKGWQKRFDELGFSFHSMDGLYWKEGVCYKFSSDQIDHIESVTQEIYDMCLKAVQYAIDENLFERLRIGERAAGLARESWARKDLSIYGRFDFSYDGRSEPKLLEFNADTPTALYESGIAQWVWLEETYPDEDQFNSIHEKLLDAFHNVKQKMPIFSTMHFACVKDHEEDFVTMEYMRDAAMQAGIATKHIHIEDIGYRDGRFVDMEEESMNFIFKLYPWEWLMEEDFGKYIAPDTAVFYEPAWKMTLSNKALLPLLWELYPGHKNLLPAYFDESRFKGDYVRKPVYSREGANIAMFGRNREFATEGTYGSEGYVYQGIKELPEFDGNYAVIGSWIVNGLAAGMGIREDNTPITKNTSAFVPHYFV
jgi:glutathionylspermidine synthase